MHDLTEGLRRRNGQGIVDCSECIKARELWFRIKWDESCKVRSNSIRLHLYRRFWNQILTWMGVRPSVTASRSRSTAFTYRCTLKRCSSSLTWNSTTSFSSFIGRSGFWSVLSYHLCICWEIPKLHSVKSTRSVQIYGQLSSIFRPINLTYSSCRFY